jgi:flagellar biosynthesis GTPase FlhF
MTGRGKGEGKRKIPKVGESIAIRTGDGEKYAGPRFKVPGLRQNGTVQVNKTFAGAYTHKNKKGQALKRPRVIFTRQDGATCGDDNYEPYINKKSGKMSCRDNETIKKEKKHAALKKARAVREANVAAKPKKEKVLKEKKQNKEQKVQDLAKATAAKAGSDKSGLRHAINYARKFFFKEAKAEIGEERFQAIYNRYEEFFPQPKARHLAFVSAIKSGMREPQKKA